MIIRTFSFIGGGGIYLNATVYYKGLDTFKPKSKRFCTPPDETFISPEKELHSFESINYNHYYSMYSFAEISITLTLITY